MSLRAAKSLPSLRSAFQHAVKDSTTPLIPKINVQNFATSSVHNSQASIPTSKFTSTRQVHQTAQKNSTLLNSVSNRYGSMNLQALKLECRTRGIKVSGKKLDLVHRLVTNDESRIIQHEGSRNIATRSDHKASTELFKDFQKKISRKLSTKKVDVSLSKKFSSSTKAEISQPIGSGAQVRLESKVVKKFSTSSNTNAKGDTSSVDSLKFPAADYVIPQPRVSAPSLLPKAPFKEIDVVETKTQIAEMEGAVSVGGDNVGEVAVHENIFKKFLIDEAVESDPQPKFEPSEEEVSSKDKWILGGIVGGIIGWWGLKPKSQK